MFFDIWAARARTKLLKIWALRGLDRRSDPQFRAIERLYKVLPCTNVFGRTTVALWKMLPRLAWLTLRLSLMCFADTILLVREVDSLLWFCP